MYHFITFIALSMAFIKGFLRPMGAMHSWRSSSNRQHLSGFSFVSVIFCILFSVFGLLDLDLKERRLEEKFREYTQESLDLDIQSLSSFSGNGGSSGLSPEVRKLQITLNIYSLPLSNLWAQPISADLPIDPQATWNADPSPPLLNFS